MQFKYPELLFALFLLVIPILIHLFQLRKFKKEPFTNIKFLKRISIRTRKSSQIKKWLVLFTRLFALAALIIAFAQPFFVSSTEALQARETVVYLDNSYSMQSKGERGRLLKRNVQELMESLPESEKITLFTNNNTYKDIQGGAARSELQQISYSARDMDFASVKLKAESEFSTSENHNKIFIAISDFQKSKGSWNMEQTGFNTKFVVNEPQNINNVSIDSAFVATSGGGENSLVVVLSANGKPPENTPISVYNEEQLIGKSSVSFSGQNTASAEFSLPDNTEIKGRVSVNDDNLLFDNELYFSIQKSEPIKVVAISGADNQFLQKIYSAPDFDFTAFEPDEVNYSVLTAANFVVLNQLKNLPTSLAGNIGNLLKNDAGLLIIPSKEIDLNSYNGFLRAQELPIFSNQKNQEKLITGISFSHPIYEGVFNEEVRNFEYPKVQSYYPISGGAAKVLAYEDGNPFLLQKQKKHLFTAALDSENSNFKNSPLIVPTLFNIGKTALKTKQLYYLLEHENKVDITVNVGNDEIVEVSDGNISFIPQQQSFSNKVSMVMNDQPEQPGNYSILKKSDVVGQLSFNIDRNESAMEFSKLENAENTHMFNSVSEAFESIKAENNIDELWKWFVIFALLFLLMEMLILKFFK